MTATVATCQVTAPRRLAHCRVTVARGRYCHHGDSRFSQPARRTHEGCQRSRIVAGRRFRLDIDLTGERASEWDAESLSELLSGQYTSEAQAWASRELVRREGYRGTGMTRAACLELWRQDVELQYLAAESECNGQLLNPAGRAAGISSRSLFMGPSRTAAAYASEELLYFWQDVAPRLTFDAWLGNQDARNSAAVSF